MNHTFPHHDRVLPNMVVSGEILVQLIIIVAQRATLNMHNISNLDLLWIGNPDMDCRVYRVIAAFFVVIVLGKEWARYVLHSSVQIASLPRPPGPIEVGMMEEEDWIHCWPLCQFRLLHVGEWKR